MGLRFASVIHSDAESRTQTFTTVSKWLSLFVIAVSCFVLVGWAAQIEILTNFLPGRVTMKPNTALGMILSSIALWFYRTPTRSPGKLGRWRTWLIRILSLLVITLGSLTLLEYQLEADLGLDSIFFNRFLLQPNLNAVDAIAGGRMAPNTSFSFMLTGGALISLTIGRYSLFQGLSLASFLIGFLALMGHLYGATALYSAGSNTGMAVNTAGLFVLLATACLLTAANQGWMRQVNSDRAGGILARRFIPVVLATPPILGLLGLLLYQRFELSVNTVTALRTLAGTCVFLGIVWWNTRSLNQIDAHRQQVQEELIESTRQFQAVFDRTYQFIGIMLPDGTLTAANSTALEFGGLTPADVVGKPFWQARWWTISPETQLQLQQAIERAAQGEFVRYEVDVRGAGDQIATIDFSLKPIFDELGNVALIIPEGRDISDRKRAEQALQQLNTELEQRVVERTAEVRTINQQIRRAIENAPFPIVIHAENGDIVQISQTLIDITGYTAEQIPTIADWTRLAYGHEQAVVIADINRLYKLDQRVDEGEYRVRCQDGSERIWAFSSAPLGYRPDGQRMVISMAADITRRKQAEAALAKRLEQQRVIAQLGQLALANHDLKSLFQQATTQLAQLLDADYCKVLELLPDGSTLLLKAGVGWQAGLVGRATVGIEESSQAGYTLRSHEPVIVRDLSTETRFSGPPLLLQHHVVSGISTIIEGRDGHPYGVLGVHSTRYQNYSPDDVNVVQAVANLLADAIARAAAEQEINQLNITLEQRVAERTRQVQEANKELEAFSYSIAHDLRAPLRSIQGFSLALLEDYGEQIDELGQEYMQRMISSAEHLDTLIQDLLDYSRLGRAEIQLRPVALSVSVESVLHELELDIQAKQAEITVRSPLPFVLAQRNVLNQVLINLIGNSLKFTADDVVPHINIWAETITTPSASTLTSTIEPSQSLESRSPLLEAEVGSKRQARSHLQSTNPSPTDSYPNQWIRLWIEDNGIGIEPQYQERIFRAFERLHGVEAYPGTGIGLAIVHRGVTRMGGCVGLESEPGQGSRFWIELQQPRQM